MCSVVYYIARVIYFKEIKKMIVRAQALKTQAYNLILSAIKEQEIEPGRIYSEQWFAEKFGISRTPVREALLQLRNEGMVDTLSNRGIMIKPMSIEDAESIYQTRTAIEGFCAANLARGVKASDPEALEVLKKVEELLNTKDSTRKLDIDLEFHRQMILYAKNVRLESVFNQMFNRMSVYWNVSTEILGRSERAYQEHTKILNAIKEGESLKAYELSQWHMKQMCSEVTELLKEKGY